MSDLRKGTRVRYVPTHAHHDINHPGCQDGVVKRVGESGIVFVLYDNASCRMVTGDEPYTAQGTALEDLVVLGDCGP